MGDRPGAPRRLPEPRRPSYGQPYGRDVPVGHDDYYDRQRAPAGYRSGGYPDEYDVRPAGPPRNPYAVQQRPPPPRDGYQDRPPSWDTYTGRPSAARPRGSIHDDGLTAQMRDLRVNPRPPVSGQPLRYRYDDVPPIQRADWDRRPSEGYPRDGGYLEPAGLPPRSYAGRPQAPRVAPARYDYDDRWDRQRPPVDPRRPTDEYDDRRGSGFGAPPPRRGGPPSRPNDPYR